MSYRRISDMTRTFIKLTSYGDAVLALLDTCGAHNSSLLTYVLGAHDLNDRGAVECAFIRMANIARGESVAGWAWYEDWRTNFDEVRTITEVLDALMLITNENRWRYPTEFNDNIIYECWANDRTGGK